MEGYVRVHTEPGFTKSEKSPLLADIEEGKYYFFEMERVRDIFLGKLIEKVTSPSGRVTDLVIEHTYNRNRIPTQTSFGIMYLYRLFEVEEQSVPD